MTEANEKLRGPSVGIAVRPPLQQCAKLAQEARVLRGEWNVIVLDAHFAAAFTARDLGDGGDDDERRFDFCMTYDRELVIAAARTLMERIAAR